MTELKTLKELQRFEDLKHSDHFIVSSSTLREEAKKWLEHFDREKYRDYKNESYGAWLFVKHFFNLEDKE